MREALLFSGLRRPAVRVVERRGMPGRQRHSAWVGDSGELQWQEALVIETSGNGRPYEVECAEAWWRDLAEVRLDDERRVVSFLQRRGDPIGKLEPGKPIITSEWEPLHIVLRQVSRAWESDKVLSWKLGAVA
jgi:hypothetical protein